APAKEHRARRADFLRRSAARRAPWRACAECNKSLKIDCRVKNEEDHQLSLERKQVGELGEDLVAEIGDVEGRAALAVVSQVQRAAGGEIVSEQRIDAQVVAVPVAGVLREHAGSRLRVELVSPA